MISIPASAVKANSDSSELKTEIDNIDESQIELGIITIGYKPKNKSKNKVMISKGKKKDTYDLVTGESYPLQHGNGEYTVAILENVKANAYRYVEKKQVNLSLKKENANNVYLQSTHNINWNNDMDIIKTAKRLTKNIKSDKKKAEVIYNYVVKNIKYDYQKASTIGSHYTPSIEDTATSLLGICYDYTSLYAAMLRSVGVPTKLVKGYNKDIKDYHSWNQVYIKNTGKWITVDPTYDASLFNNVPRKKINKVAKHYTINYIY